MDQQPAPDPLDAAMDIRRFDNLAASERLWPDSDDELPPDPVAEAERTLRERLAGIDERLEVVLQVRVFANAEIKQLRLAKDLVTRSLAMFDKARRGTE